MVRVNYMLATLVLLLIEVAIALFVHDTVVRPFVGDTLVVPLVYCFLRIFVPGSPATLAVCVLVLSFVVETLQYFDYVALLHLENNRLLSTILGRTFSWLDFVAYLLGFALIRACDRKKEPAGVLSQPLRSSSD